MKFINFSLICLALFFISLSESYGTPYDSVKAELSGKNWENTLLNSAESKKIGDSPGRFSALLELVANTAVDWRVRIRGIRVIAETGDPRAAEFLMSLFYNSFAHSECPAIKSSLATALGKFRDNPRIVDALITGLDDQEVLVREASASSLGRIGDRRALSFLVEKFNDPSAAVRVNAIRAVSEMGDIRAVPFLKTLIARDTDGFVRVEAKMVLAALTME